MKRVEQITSPREGYVAPVIDIIAVATECGIAQSPEVESLPIFEDGGPAF